MDRHLAQGYKASKGVTITKPFVYGNAAKSFGSPRQEDGHTHRWAVYIKPYLDEDLSAYVSKVVFKLHESYANPIRTVTQPPFQVTETGWGEFEVNIKIFFKDPSEKSVKVSHVLKLFQNDPDIMSGKKTLVFERYDEMIFEDPSPMMQQLLTRQPNLQPDPQRSHYESIKKEQLNAIRAASVKIKEQIQQAAEQLKENRAKVRAVKSQMSDHNA